LYRQAFSRTVYGKAIFFAPYLIFINTTFETGDWKMKPKDKKKLGEE
jgi:hypothetical protein